MLKRYLTDMSELSFPQKILFLSAVVAFLWAVYFSVETICLPYQIEQHEGTALVQTWFLLRLENPFTLENQPLGMNNYGMGYSTAVLPFAALFGNTLAVHRTVSFGFIVLSALLSAFVVHRAGKDLIPSMACAALVMIGLIARGGAGAFPGAMGTFLFLTALLLPFVRSFDFPSLAVSILLSLAAFYTKPYFVLSFGIVLSYLFLFISKKKSIIYGLAFIFVLLISVLSVRRLFPVYFIDTFFGNVANTSMSTRHLTAQLLELLLNLAPVLIYLWVVVFIRLRRRGGNAVRGGFLNGNSFLSIDSPLLTRPLNYFFYSCLCSLAAFILILGPHIGSYMSYAYQLVVPLFLCWFFCEIVPQNGMRLFLAVAVMLNLLFWGQKVLNPGMLKQGSRDEWAELLGYMKSSSNILNSPQTTSQMVELGFNPVDSGQTIFYYNVEPYPANMLTEVPYEQVRADGLRFENLINRQIEKQRFDLVISVKDKGSFYDLELVKKYYFPVSEITVEMPHVGEKWILLLWKPIVQ